MRRGIGNIDDLRARSVLDPTTRCWIWQGAQVGGAPRIWALHIDEMDKKVLSGPRAVWYIAHGTKLGARVAYMSCWNKRCVCPVHVRSTEKGRLTHLAALAGVFKRSTASQAANKANINLARAARGVVDLPAETVLAVRAAAGTGTQIEIGQRFGVSKSMVSRMLRGKTYRHLLPDVELGEQAHEPRQAV